MKKNLFLIIVVLMCSCSIFRPKGFEYKYDAQYTGIDTLINISGYYQTEYVPGESIMFYQDGLMCVTGSDPKERFDLFNEGSVSWGTYIISGDTIKAQFIAYFGLMDGGYYVSNDYHKIVSNNKIISIRSKKSNEFYIKKVYFFHPLENRRSSYNWLLDKKWFWKEGYYPKK